MENNKMQRFVALLKTCERSGIDKIIEYLTEETDFFQAPASTKFHGCHEQGLLEHSLNVFDVLASMPYTKNENYESIIICSLLHDICKANFYSTALNCCCIC